MKLPAPIRAALREELGATRVPFAREVAALAELFELFTKRRGRLRGFNYLDDPRLRRAYLRYHLPLNLARSTCVLRDLAAVAPELARPRAVVDLGCGPASSSLATLCELESPEEFVLADRSASALKTGAALLERTAAALGRRVRVHRVAQRLPALPRIPEASLVWLSMVLNETDRGRDADAETSRLFLSLAQALDERSVVVVIEPALRQPGLRLLELRELLLASGDWQVVAPCTHAAACPLLGCLERPWCHFHLRHELDADTRRIARRIGLDDERGALSYLVLRRKAVDEAPMAGDARRGRVIGDPMRVGKSATPRGVYVCAAGERRLARWSDSPPTRGDVIELGDGDRIERVVRAWPDPEAADRTAGCEKPRTAPRGKGGDAERPKGTGRRRPGGSGGRAERRERPRKGTAAKDGREARRAPRRTKGEEPPDSRRGSDGSSSEGSATD